MIGHNLEGIDNLIMEIEGSYSSLGEVIAQGWPNVVKTLETEWIGPDEKSFEEQLANKVCELYIASKQSFLDMAANITRIGQSWIEFQNQNIINGATISREEYTFKVPQLDDYDITTTVKVTPFATYTGMNYGVVNGQESATKINNDLNSYIGSINQKLTALASHLSADAAFLGASQAETIEEYMTTVTKYVGGLIGLVSELQPILDQLVKNYVEQAATFVQATQKESSDVASQTFSSK